MKKTLKILLAKIIRRLGIANNLRYYFKLSFGKNKLKIPMTTSTGNTIMEELITFKPSFKTFLLEILKSYSHTDYFVDVGANAGQTLVEVYGNNLTTNYIGFEPNPKAFELLSEVIRLNKLNAEIFPFACNEKSTIVRLFSNLEIDAGATIFSNIRQEKYKNQKGLCISSHPLDEVLSDSIPNRFILKIDTEGSENEVIKGAINTILSKRPLIICEVLNAHSEMEIKNNNSRKIELENMLSKISYSIYSLLLNYKNELNNINKISNFPKDILYKKNPQSDYIFIPNELKTCFEESISESFT